MGNWDRDRWGDSSTGWQSWLDRSHSLSMPDFGKRLTVRLDWRPSHLAPFDWGIAAAWGVSPGVLSSWPHTALGGLAPWWTGAVVWVVCGMPDPKPLIPTLSLCISRLLCLKHLVTGKDDTLTLVWLCWPALPFPWKDTADSLKGLGTKGQRQGQRAVPSKPLCGAAAQLCPQLPTPAQWQLSSAAGPLNACWALPPACSCSESGLSQFPPRGLQHGGLVA